MELKYRVTFAVLSAKIIIGNINNKARHILFIISLSYIFLIYMTDFSWSLNEQGERVYNDANVQKAYINLKRISDFVNECQIKTEFEYTLNEESCMIYVTFFF